MLSESQVECGAAPINRNRKFSPAGHAALQLTRAADYALRAIVYLAGLPPGVRLMLPDLARATQLPESFLSKILQSLCRAGFIESHRGHFGGFRILPAARTATMVDIIEVIEGPISLNSCTEPHAEGHCGPDCALHSVWLAAQAAVLRVLKARTIGELAAEQRTSLFRQNRISASRLPGMPTITLEEVRRPYSTSELRAGGG